MERFLVRNQVPKPDPGIVNRAAKAKKHRKLEKLADATIYKRKKLETRAAFLHDQEVKEPTIGHNIASLVGTVYNVAGGGAHGNIRSLAVGRTARAAQPAAEGREATPGHQARAFQYRPPGNVLRIHAPGEGHLRFLEIAGPVGARAQARDARARIIPARGALEGHARYFEAAGLAGNEHLWNEVGEDSYRHSVQVHDRLAKPRRPLAPGLTFERALDIERGKR